MSAADRSSTEAEVHPRFCYVARVPILLQKSTRLGLRAKMRNNRIGTDEFLNQRCALVFDLESILLVQTLKMVLQQYLPEAGRTLNRGIITPGITRGHQVLG
jgi:hypothetical protein